MFVYQEDPTGCRLAVLANLTGKPYREIATRAVALSGCPQWLNSVTWIDSDEQKARNEAVRQIAIENKLPEKIGFTFAPVIWADRQIFNWNFRGKDFHIYQVPNSFNGLADISIFSSSLDEFPFMRHSLFIKNGMMFDPDRSIDCIAMNYVSFSDGETPEQFSKRMTDKGNVFIRFDHFNGVNDEYYFPGINMSERNSGKPFRGNEIEALYSA